MSNAKERLERAQQRIERERQRARKAERELREEKRKLDTRRKILAGAFLLDVMMPNLNEDARNRIADRFARMIVGQTQKKKATRRQELDLFRDVFGDHWVQRWSSDLGDDEST